MPSSFSSLDTGFPNLNKYGSTEQKLQAIESYLVQLLEQLRYTLNNLSQDNFNTKEVTNWLGEIITEPVRIAIENVEDQIQTQIDVSAEGVKSTVAKGLKQYDTSGVTGGIDYYGYGDPTVPAAGNNGKKYLDQNTGFYWTCNGSTWTKSTNALPLITDKKQDSATLITTINQSASKIQTSAIKYDSDNTHLLSSWMEQTAEDISARVTNEEMESAIEASADDIMLSVKGDYADEWVTNHQYYVNDVVKRTVTSGGATTITFYRCTADHTSSTAPPNANWAVVQSPNIQSVIDLNVKGITLSYDDKRIGYTEWAASTAYKKDSVVSVTGASTVNYYKATQDHTSSNSNKPGTTGGGSYWTGTTKPEEHNGAFITLNKDGATIGGGKVFIKDLDASTITTGTLDANVITLREAFSVQSKDSHNVYQDCGSIGGYARLNGNNEITIASSNGKSVLCTEDGAVYMEYKSSATKYTSVDALPDYVEIQARDGDDRVWFEVTPTAINFKKAGGAWHDLFDLI